MRRLANMANAPVLGILGEVGYSRGQTVINAMGLGGYYHREFDARMDAFNALSYTSTSLIMAGTLASYAIAFVISSATVVVMLNSGAYSGADVGLALSYAFTLPFFLQLLTTMVSLFLTSLTGLERLLQCSGGEVPQEPEWHLPGDAALPAEWPDGGAVEFRSASLVYRPGLAPALRGVTLSVPAGSSAGVVGRTGAGKSSLLVLLFRLHDPAAGRVLVGGVDVAAVGLQTLRGRLAVIPQEPLLVGGTVRDNVDPFRD
eukprot:gene1392-18592_t